MGSSGLATALVLVLVLVLGFSFFRVTGSLHVSVVFPQSAIRNWTPPPLPADNMVMGSNTKQPSSVHHHGPVAEVVGFICRWLLLGGAAGLIGLVAWESLLATVNVSQDINCRFVVPDRVCRAGLEKPGICYQPGLLVGRGMASGLSAVLAVRQAEPIAMGLIDSPDTFYICWPGCQAGAVEAVCVGAPYSSLAFQRQRACVLGVPDGRQLTLVDARLAPPRGKTPRLAWQEAVAAMARLGEVALFCPNATPAEYETMLAEYRNAGGKLPVLYRRGKMPYLFRRVAADLARPKRTGMSIVTGDAQLAGLAAKAGFAVHLIAPPPATPNAPARITHHATLGEFKDSLPPPPIRR